MENRLHDRSRRMDKADLVMDKIFFVLTWLGIAAAIYIMLSTFVNVFFRAFLKNPIFGIVDTAQIIMPICALCPMPVVTLLNTHFKVDIIFNLFPTVVQKILTVFNLILASATMFVMSYYTFIKAASVKGFGTMSQALNIPFYPIYYLIAIMIGISGLCAIYNIVHFIVTGTLIEVETFDALKERVKAEKKGGKAE